MKMPKTTKPTDKQGPSLIPHPIQLIKVGVKELSIRANVPPEEGAEIELKDCSIITGHSKYDEKDKTIGVSLRLELGSNENDPVILKIQVIGLFQVDEHKFPVKAVSQWAKENAPIILFPYLREQAYGLTSRCGFKPLILPLVEVQTISIEQPKERKKKAAKQPRSAIS